MSGELLREVLAAAMPEHQSWCHAEAHADCCNADDCDCGVTDALDRLLPVVLRYGRDKAAEELRAAASEPDMFDVFIGDGVSVDQLARLAAELNAADPT